MAEKEAVATAIKAPSLFRDMFELIVLHEILNLKAGGKEDYTSILPADDPRHKKDQKNELAMAQFLVYFREEYPTEAALLQLALKKMATSDYKLLSLAILESALITSASQPMPAEDSGLEKPYFFREAPVSPNKPEKGKGVPKETTKKEVVPNLHFRGNYSPVMEMIAKTIQQTNDPDPDQIINALMVSGLVSQSQLVKLARYLKSGGVVDALSKIGDFLDDIGETMLPATIELVNKATDFCIKMEGRLAEQKTKNEEIK